MKTFSLSPSVIHDYQRDGAVVIRGALDASELAQRAPEMGIRMAIGARAGDVRRMILGEGMRLVGAGIGLGIAASLLVTRFMAFLLFDVSPTEPVTFASISLGLIVWLSYSTTSRSVE